MSKVAVPILKLTYNQRDAYPKAITEIFQDEKAWDDHLTFSGGVALPKYEPASAKKRDRIKVKLEALFRKHYGENKFIKPLKTILELLEEHDWCVSFYVDL